MIHTLSDLIITVMAATVGVLAVNVIAHTWKQWRQTPRRRPRKIRMTLGRPKTPKLSEKDAQRLWEDSMAPMVPGPTNTRFVPIYDPDNGDYLGSVLLWNHDNSLVEPVTFHE